MIKVKKHRTCVGCFAGCVEFPDNMHYGGIAFCTLGYPVSSGEINHEKPSDHEAIPIGKCPRPTTHKEFCEASAPMALIKTS